MRIRYQKLKGMEVLANKEGRLLGSLRRLQLDSKKKVAVGIVYKGKLMSGEHWSRVSGIERVGEDVVFLTQMRVVKDDEAKGRDVKDMLGLPIMTMDGKRLGSLDDVILDVETWKIAGVILDTGGAVEVSTEAVFGEDTILLRKGAGDAIVHDVDEQGGFLARVFSADADKPKKRTRKKPAAKNKKKAKKR